MSRTLAIANIKGGVGKTTTTANLAAALGQRGRHVLAIDLDPQASLTLTVGGRTPDPGQTIREALSLEARPLSSLLFSTAENFDLVPAGHSLRTLERELEDGHVRLFALRDALAPVRTRYDYILLDCPANAGILTGNALTAADEVIIPFAADYLALEAVDWLLRIIGETQRVANPRLRVAGFLLSMYTPRTKHTREVLMTARKRYGLEIPFFAAAIPLNVHLREAPLAGQTILRFDNDSPGAAAFRILAGEVEEGIREVEPVDAQGAVRRARVALAAGEGVSAYRDFCHATEFDPELPEGWIGRASSTADGNEALRCWAKALQLDPASAVARDSLDSRLKERLEHAAAHETPELAALGHYLLEVNQRSYAEPVFRRVTELDPAHEEGWLGWAQATADSQVAVQKTRHALELNPASVRAREGLETAQQRMRDEAAGLVGAARELMQKGERERAHRVFMRAAELDPRSDGAWLGCARTTDDQQAGLGYVRKALEANPESEEARNLYHWLWTPERESLELPIGLLLSIAVALLILGVAIFVILQRLNPS